MVEHEKNEESLVFPRSIFGQMHVLQKLTISQIHVLTLRENLNGKTKELGSVSFTGVVFLDVYYPRKLVSLNFKFYNSS